MKPKILHAAPVEAAEMEVLVSPKLLRPLPAGAYEQLALYVDLLARWNRRMNLTAVRDPRVLLELHIAECLRCAQMLPPEIATAMDFGSGAGLPGIPMKIARPEIAVTLAESQNKKAAFLREAARELGLAQTTVHSGRVEDLPMGSTFDLVILRAVDDMGQALRAALPRIRGEGYCAVLTSTSQESEARKNLPGLEWLPPKGIPGTRQRVFLLGQKLDESK